MMAGRPSAGGERLNVIAAIMIMVVCMATVVCSTSSSSLDLVGSIAQISILLVLSEYLTVIFCCHDC